MTVINSKTTTHTRATETATWSSNVKNTSRALELGMKTLQSLVMPDGKVPGGLFSATMTAVREGVDLLQMLLKKRFDVPLSKSDLGMLDVAQRALSKGDSAFYKMDKQIDAARVPPGAVAFPSDWFGDVDSAAAKLVAAANKSGKPQYVDFNSHFLIASPGQTATDVVADWRTASTGRNPLGNMSYEVERRGADEATKRDLLAVAKQPPRSLSKVLGDLQKLIDKGDYKSPMLAGLCELKHPKEIKAFVEHYLENPERKGDTPIDTARKAAEENIKFWVNVREGASPGTEASWNTALDEVLKARASGGGKPQAIDNKPAAGGARDINAILGDLNKMVKPAGHYGHTFMAGLCELKNPADIKTFLTHYYANPDKKDASTPLAQARETMVKNTIFWARDREGTAPGTKDTWLKTINEVVEANKPIELPFQAGGHIDGTTEKMAALAKEKNRPVSYEFNGIQLLAQPGDTAEKVKQPFTDAMAEARKRYAEAAAVEAKARQGRVDAFTAGGGVIIEKPPADMKFDTRGLVPPGGLYNSKGTRALQLITEAQLSQLPTGTKLTSISGNEVIKGIDHIDNDNRGGFIAFGFLQ